MEREINETLSNFMARIENTDLSFDDGILLSRNVKIPVLLDGVDNEIVKTPIAWSLWDYKMFYIVDVPAGTEIAPHKHDESIFRVLISGDLEINGISIDIGEWFVVKAETIYSIKTTGGYKSLSGYQYQCRTSRMNALHLEKSL
jgi:hypothetical protein